MVENCYSFKYDNTCLYFFHKVLHFKLMTVNAFQNNQLVLILTWAFGLGNLIISDRLIT